MRKENIIKKSLFMMICTILLGGTTIAKACVHTLYGTPKQSDLIECREGYALGYSYTLKSAEWVSYKLDRQIGKGVERTNDFRPNKNIPKPFRTTPQDYLEPIYHQGHLGNSESIDGTETAMSETFLMSNIVPQLPKHNIGIWKGLENRERKWANKIGSVIVLTGPIYEGVTKTIGVNKVPIPSHFWKVIYSPKSTKAIAYLIDHKNLKTKDLDRYLVSIDTIELRTGLNLLEALPDTLERGIESTAERKQW